MNAMVVERIVPNVRVFQPGRVSSSLLSTTYAPVCPCNKFPAAIRLTVGAAFVSAAQAILS